MATPKKRRSLERRRRRRAQSKVVLPNVVKCENCSNARLPHHICQTCGWYKNRCVIEPNTKE